jgi:hypothetical protein
VWCLHKKQKRQNSHEPRKEAGFFYGYMNTKRENLTDDQIFQRAISTSIVPDKDAFAQALQDLDSIHKRTKVPLYRRVEQQKKLIKAYEQGSTREKIKVTSRLTDLLTILGGGSSLRKVK